ncbi:Rpn family recombination-promoting nuclease/putative transposase [Segatella copri]|uniref:Rpn family recombination-promoting nuclease/putative transposase n=1 Tax=Segatella copri TaxID=165179 RepID=UPI0020CA6E58|nr:Rpn family recombination-promoting nuclease/putative transposase [Segatella copri]
MKYLDPKADLTFKKIFGNHPARMISLLNALLPLSEEEQIHEIKYLPTELVPEINSYRYAIANILCTDAKSNKFCVVIRIEWSNFFEQRVQFQASELYVNPTIKQKKYFAQYPTYSLNLINDTFKYDTPEFIHNYRIVYDKDTHQVIEGLHFTFIELPKFMPHSVADKRMMVLWLRFLTEIDEDTQEIPSELLKDPEIGKAIEELEIFDFTDVELRVYDKFWDSVSVERTLLDDSYQKGLEEGRKVAELNKVLQIARNLLNLGLSISEIIEITGLTQEQIEHLKES